MEGCIPLRTALFEQQRSIWLPTGRGALLAAAAGLAGTASLSCAAGSSAGAAAAAVLPGCLCGPRCGAGALRAAAAAEDWLLQLPASIAADRAEGPMALAGAAAALPGCLLGAALCAAAGALQ
eukprot:TRINITY_DN42040_c0_g1_i2.p3 TRINITY_DN42040_c0_g1~~TRINITY_DN42040_c0_g1_i2.p3  ORF type:complete len:123 (+),score=28.97 TRINITY_DN42040_c0_g1_i2:79-447(+)